MVDKISPHKQEIPSRPSPSARHFTHSSESPYSRNNNPPNSSDLSDLLSSGAIEGLRRHWTYQENAKRYSEIAQPNNKQEELKALADELAMDTYGKKDV